jgi:outer membrane protein assembly factor BamE (lipoprotein component of BamABCDE complex)
MKSLQTFSLLCVCALAACEPLSATRGNLLESEKVAEIKVGESTREDVAAKLGTPTQTGTFNDKDWYYIGRQTEQESFLDPKVINQKAIRVAFDDEGKVTAVEDMDLSEAHDVPPVARSTPTYGSQYTIIQQLIGNLGHPVPSIKKRQEGQ